jgi:hypothetical protein
MISDHSILGVDGAVVPKHAKFVHLHLMIMAISHTPPSLLSPTPSRSTSFQMMAVEVMAQTAYPLCMNFHPITVMKTTAMMTVCLRDHHHLCHMMRCVFNRETCFPCCARCACSAPSLRFLRFLHLLRFLRPPLSLYPQRLQCSLRPLSSLRPLWLLPNTKTT